MTTPYQYIIAFAFIFKQQLITRQTLQTFLLQLLTSGHTLRTFLLQLLTSGHTLRTFLPQLLTIWNTLRTFFPQLLTGGHTLRTFLRFSEKSGGAVLGTVWVTFATTELEAVLASGPGRPRTWALSRSLVVEGEKTAQNY